MRRWGNYFHPNPHQPQIPQFHHYTTLAPHLTPSLITSHKYLSHFPLPRDIFFLIPPEYTIRRIQHRAHALIYRPDKMPSIRESYFGDSLGRRRVKELASTFQPGPPDLCHVAKYAGTHLATFVNHDFVTEDDRPRDDEGYIGYYHYVNGMELARLEAYIMAEIGMIKEGDGWVSDKKEERKRETVVTYCVYNVFTRQDFRTRYVIYPLKKGPVAIDKSYQLIGATKTQLFHQTSIHELPPHFWDEIRASQVVRLFYHGDNPGEQPVGMVNFRDFVASSQALVSLAFLMVRQLRLGYMAGQGAGFGTATNCGNAGDRKTNFYRNNLVEALGRICQLDPASKVSEFIISEIDAEYEAHEFDWVALQVYKYTNGANREPEYLQLLNDHWKHQSVYTTQLGLMLLDQVHFLITKNKYRLALTLAQKCIGILPLDFECWYTLLLCYLINGDDHGALLMMNLLPVVVKPPATRRYDDFFVHTYMKRASSGEPISEKTFMEYFPPPETGRTQRIWQELFVFNPQWRHPMVGPWYQLPLMLATAKEIATVNHNVVRLSQPLLPRMQLCGQLQGFNIVSVVDFYRKLTWGRAYDLLSMMVAISGWDRVMEAKRNVLSGGNHHIDVVDSATVGKPQCEPWLDLLFAVLYEDLKVVGSDSLEANLALSWLLTGLLGWSTKINLRELILALVTAVIGNTDTGGFDYFATIQLLEIYNEFMLLECGDTQVDGLGDLGPRFFSNKLIVKLVLPKVYNQFLGQLETNYFTLEFILLHVMRLVSWYLRWYHELPPFIVLRVLSKLLIKYDSMVVRTTMKVVFELNKKRETKSKGWFGSKQTVENDKWIFCKGDDILESMEALVGWLEKLA